MPRAVRQRNAPLPRRFIAFAAVATLSPLAVVEACSAQAPSPAGPVSLGPCLPFAGTYVVTYTNESNSDASSCAAPATTTVTLPFDAGTTTVTDAAGTGIACTHDACTESCTGVIEGFPVTATTTVVVAPNNLSYSGTTTQTTDFPDGQVLSSCSYSYSASPADE
jgi:hypothetical protein